MLRDTANRAGGAVVPNPTAGDTVELAGITRGERARNRGHFAFHG